MEEAKSVIEPQSHLDFTRYSVLLPSLASIGFDPKRTQLINIPVIKNPSANGRHRRHGSIPGWGRCPGGGHATHSSILAWRIPWTEEPGGLWSVESQSQTQLR